VDPVAVEGEDHHIVVPAGDLVVRDYRVGHLGIRPHRGVAGSSFEEAVAAVAEEVL